MKNLIRSFSIFLLFITISITNNFAQKQFEGKVNMKYSDNKGIKFMDYLIKENKLRLEWKDNKGNVESSMITDIKAMKMFILMQKNKSYIEHQIKSTKEDDDEIMEKTNKNIQLTNERKIINGFNCQKVILKGEENSEMWITKDIKVFAVNKGENSSANMPDWYSELVNAGCFAILVINKDKKGKEENRLEVTSVERKALDDDMFRPPADFKKMNVPGYNFLK
ncbi:MAG: hypothetical protein STSR0008_04720 [Ignavibacterium sp.]